MKDIKGFEGLYAITKKGKIWSYPNKRGQAERKGKFLKTWLIGHGYQMVMLYGQEKPKKFLVHRLVALTYIPNPKNLTEVNHRNANILDNRVSNLEWVSSRQNKQHAIKLGLYKSHEKLSASQIKEIRKRYKGKGKGIKQSELAEEYGVTQSNISWIIRGRGWFHVI